MAALHLLLVVACVASLASEALGGCATANWGRQGNWPLAFNPVELYVEHGDTVTIRLPYPGYGCNVVGVEVQMCGVKNLIFTGQLTLVAELIQTVHFKGKATGVIYCDAVVPSTENTPI